MHFLAFSPPPPPKTSCWKLKCALYMRKYGSISFCCLSYGWPKAKVKHREQSNEQAHLPSYLLHNY